MVHNWEIIDWWWHTKCFPYSFHNVFPSFLSYRPTPFLKIFKLISQTGLSIVYLFFTKNNSGKLLEKSSKMRENTAVVFMLVLTLGFVLITSFKANYPVSAIWIMLVWLRGSMPFIQCVAQHKLDPFQNSYFSKQRKTLKFY